MEIKELSERNKRLLELCRCSECPLQTNGAGPVFGHGPTDAATLQFVVVAEAPGKVEVNVGMPMQGPSGLLSDEILKEVGTDRSKVYVTNTTLCRPHDPKDPDKDERPGPDAIRACSTRLKAELAGLNTPIIVSTGNVATQSLAETKNKISSLLGATMWSDTHNKFIIPTYHPSYVLRGNTSAAPDIIDAYKRAKQFGSKEVPLPEKNLKITWSYVTSAAMVSKALDQIEKELEKPVTFGLDTETQYAGDPNFELIMVQVSTLDRTWVLEAEPLLTEPNRSRFARLIEHENGTWVLHNLSFDFQYLQHNFDTVPKRTHDTMALALCLTEKANQVGLKSLSRKYLNAPFYEEELSRYPKPSALHPWGSVPRNILVPYAAKDARYTVQLLPVLENLVEREGNRHLYDRILLPTQKAFADMEYYGVLVDGDELDRTKEEWEPIVAQKLKDCQEYAKGLGFDAKKIKDTYKVSELNPNSVPHKKHLFYEILRKRKVYNLKPNKDGERTLNTGELYYEANPTHKSTALFQGYSKVTKMVSTYVTGVEDDIEPDGRIRTNFKLFGAVTGRISSSDPPIQTVPGDKVQKEAGLPSLRAFYTVPDDCWLIEADYNSLEMWIAYHYTHDEAILTALRTADFHKTKASQMFVVPFEQVTELQRHRSKTVTYGVMYGMTPQYLSNELKISVKQAEIFIKKWMEGFPIFSLWYSNQQQLAITTGESRTQTGRVRRWEVTSPSINKEIKKQSVNFPIQSLANDLCLMSLCELNTLFKNNGMGRVLFTVHDSIVLEIKKQHLAEAVKIIHDVMTRPKFDSILSYHPIGVNYGSCWSSDKMTEFEMPYAKAV